MLSGYKTYLASAISILTGVLAYANGKESLSTALTSVPGLMAYLGLIAASMRKGIKTERATIESDIARVEAKLPSSVQAIVEPEVSKVEATVNSAQ